MIAAKRLLNWTLEDSQGEREAHEIMFGFPQKIFLSLLRLLSSGERWADGTYRARIDGFSERLDSFRREPWVSGRVYSSSGETTIYSLEASLGILLLMRMPHPSLEVHRLLPNGWFERFSDGEHRSVERISERANAVVAWLHQCEQNKIKRILETLGMEIGESLPDRINNLTTALNLIATEQDENLRDRIIDNDPSEDRLIELAGFSSQSGFEKDTAEFPISKFKVSDIIDEGQDLTWSERKLIFKNHQKGELLSPSLIQVPSNEDSWFDQIIREHVANVVMHLIFEGISTENIFTDDPKSFWALVTKSAKQMNKPVLIIPLHLPPEWFMEWLYEREEKDSPSRPQNFNFLMDRVAGDNGRVGLVRYDDDRRGILIQRGGLPSGRCGMFDMDDLNTINFLRYENGYPVTVQFVPYEEDPLRGELTLEWSVKFLLGTGSGLIIDTIREVATLADSVNK